jgi:ferredoxin
MNQLEIASEQPWVIPMINRQRCSGCGWCAALCPTHAVEVLHQYAVIVRPTDCLFCAICETYCPLQAIERPFTVVFADER